MLDNTEANATAHEEDVSGSTADAVRRASPDRSTIAFPYAHLEDALNVAQAIYGSGIPLSRAQVAGLLNADPASGGFSLKVGAARTFRLIETVDGKYQLSALGERMLSHDEIEARNARREAFLRASSG